MRSEKALYDSMKAIRDRLEGSLVVQHPVTPGETITNGPDDAKARFLKERLAEALGWLNVLFDPQCTRADALAAWDKVFNTTYFTDQLEEEKTQSGNKALAAPAILSAGLLKVLGESATAQPAVKKEGGGRYA